MSTTERCAVLVLSAPEDATADLVEAHLALHDVPVVRMDTGDFPIRLRTVFRNDGAGWRGRVREHESEIDLTGVRSVYYRRPTRFRLPEGLSAGDAAFAGVEARLGFGGALSELPALWVNHPARVAMAERKASQLAAAAKVGLAVPRTAITNDIDALRDFAADIGGPVVCKTFSSMVLDDGETGRSVFTTVIDPAQVDAEEFAATAHLVQEWLPKAYEARVTMVGARPFTAAIHAGSDAAQVDWRADYRTLRYERIEPPPEVTAGMRRYLARFGLVFGAFDFVVQPDESWRFLECNANGQWQWLEDEVGLPIAAELAALLAGEVPPC